jgi:hypothetical protein
MHAGLIGRRLARPLALKAAGEMVIIPGNDGQDGIAWSSHFQIRERRSGLAKLKESDCRGRRVSGGFAASTYHRDGG